MKDLGVNIVATSNSWGGGDFSQALIDAIDEQRQSDILFITAAGNGNFFGIGQNNDTSPFYPCDTYLPNVICVAATDRTDDGYSSRERRCCSSQSPRSDSGLEGNQEPHLNGRRHD
jgi:Subtilase family